MKSKKWHKKLMWGSIKVVSVILGIGILLLIISAKTPPVIKPSSKYQITITEGESIERYDCHNYTRDENTYILFDTLGIKTNEITVFSGKVHAKLNKQIIK